MEEGRLEERGVSGGGETGGEGCEGRRGDWRRGM